MSISKFSCQGFVLPGILCKHGRPKNLERLKAVKVKSVLWPEVDVTEETCAYRVKIIESWPWVVGQLDTGEVKSAAFRVRLHRRVGGLQDKAMTDGSLLKNKPEGHPTPKWDKL